MEADIDMLSFVVTFGWSERGGNQTQGTIYGGNPEGTEPQGSCSDKIASTWFLGRASLRIMAGEHAI